MKIHLIEQAGYIHPLNENIIQSGFWAVTPETAGALIGGDIYFHKKQKEPSFYGGKIVGYEIEIEGEYSGRIIFHFEHLPEHKNVPSGSGGWSNEKKIVWS